MTSNENNHNDQQQQQIAICKLENSSNEIYLPQTLDLSFLTQLAQQQQQHPQQIIDMNGDNENKTMGKKPRRKTIRNLTNAIKKSNSNNNSLIIGDVTNENNKYNVNNDNNGYNKSEIGEEQQQDQQLQQTTNTDEIEHWLIIEGDMNGSQKRKRKACECPNCVKWRQNILTPEELSKKRTHKCHKCNKEYNKTSHLRAHLRAHDNYRPYVCDFKVCGKSFTRSDELKRHKRIHNGNFR